MTFSIYIILAIFSKLLAAELCDKDSITEVVTSGGLPGKRFFTKEVDNVNRTFECVCKKGVCYHKCCPFGYVIHLNIMHETGELCSRFDELDKMNNEGIPVHSITQFKRKVNVSQSDEFSVLFGKPCPEDVFKANTEFAVQEDGRLWIEIIDRDPPWQYVSPEDYCIDTFVSVDGDNKIEYHLDALICSLDEEVEKKNIQYILTSTCMLISCVFILATLAVYAWLPELRNLHGRVLMAYLSCLLVTFAFLAAMQILILTEGYRTVNMCLGLSVVIYYSALAAFFWLNVMSFDIWWTFSGKRGLSLEKLSSQARFAAYSLYAFGVPALLTMLMMALEFAPLSDHILLPRLRKMGCFLYGTAKLIYLYGPMIILCLANIIFFILTAVKIAKIKKQTSVLNSKDSSTHDSHSKDRQRLLLYVKLFAVMGVSWILEVVSVLCPELSVWKITDAYNVLVGLIVFIIFVCKKKILKLMKKRYAQVRGIPPMSSATQMSSRTVSSRDDIRMNSIKNNNNVI